MALDLSPSSMIITVAYNVMVKIFAGQRSRQASYFCSTEIFSGIHFYQSSKCHHIFYAQNKLLDENVTKLNESVGGKVDKNFLFAKICVCTVCNNN